jgi:tetratricopeptide (TPR) repeat protein
MDIDLLIQHADEALETGNDQVAIAAGQRLIELRHAYGFEVLARAYWARDEKTKAIRTLQDGVAKAPKLWPLWQLLGDYWTDVGDAKRAKESYEQVLANEAADSVARAHALSELDRHDEAIATAREALDDAEDDQERARLQYSIAYALWSKGDNEAALQAAWDAIALHASNEDAMWLIRELEGRKSKKAMQFRLIVEGALKGRRYLVTYEVVADDEDEARDLARRFEPEASRQALMFDIKKAGKAADLPKGVYFRSDTVFEGESD